MVIDGSAQTDPLLRNMDIFVQQILSKLAGKNNTEAAFQGCRDTYHLYHRNSQAHLPLRKDNIHLSLQPSEERMRLCSFHRSILEQIFGEKDDKVDVMFRSILRPVLLTAGYISLKKMVFRLKLKFPTLEHRLSKFQPLLIVPKDSNKPVEGLHHFFFSFLSDEGLCPYRFHVPLEWTEGAPLLAIKAAP